MASDMHITDTHFESCEKHDLGTSHRLHMKLGQRNVAQDSNHRMLPCGVPPQLILAASSKFLFQPLQHDQDVRTAERHAAKPKVSPQRETAGQGKK